MHWTRSAMKTLRAFSWKSVNRTLFFKEILNLGDAVNLQTLQSATSCKRRTMPLIKNGQCQPEHLLEAEVRSDHPGTAVARAAALHSRPGTECASAAAKRARAAAGRAGSGSQVDDH